MSVEPVRLPVRVLQHATGRPCNASSRAALGGPLPNYGAATAASVILPPGFAPTPIPSGRPAASASPVAGTPTLTLTAFPAVGALTAISGIVSGLLSPTSFIAVLYVRDAGAVNW